MKIALIIENSQAAKSSIVHDALTSVAEPLGHSVAHCGMSGPDDEAHLTYPMIGIMAGILINSNAADFIVTGCGTGMGSNLACNAMPGVFCGLVIDPTDAFLFAAELNLQDCSRKLFEGEPGLGYPRERAAVMAENRGILTKLKEASCKDMLTVLKSVDQDLLKAAVSGEKFQEFFFANSQDAALTDYVKQVLAS